MRWLLVKDLQILRRSPFLVAMLVIYPLVIAVLIGLALSRGPQRPVVAIVDEVPASQRTITLGGSQLSIGHYLRKLTESVEPRYVDSARAARALVRSGDALAAVVIPSDMIARLESGVHNARVKVIYNGSDPVKARYVESALKSQLADANAALSARFTQVATSYIGLLLNGGRLSILGHRLDILGLENARTSLRGVERTLPRGSPSRAALHEVVSFATVAIRNLGVSKAALRTLGAPIVVDRSVVDGGSTALDRYAIAVAAIVSLLFVAVLLAGGLLALEREEHAFARLVRGLVSRSGLIVEKALLAAVCALVVALVLLGALSAFVDLDWGRAPLWVPALALGALACGALGVAIGALAREVRAASLLTFLVALPVAFLALVPQGAVGGGLYDAIRAISAIFPFRPALQAANAGLNDVSPPLWQPLLHLAGLALAFGVVARIALRRFD